MSAEKKIRALKKQGIMDRQLGDEKKIRDYRKKKQITPTYKMVDTCSAEFEAKTPYYYSTYERENESNPSENKKVIILGSGPIRIGQGIEFDCCTVHAVFALKELGLETIIINNNPETVSTDFDISDKLYFEPLTLEDVLNVVDNESVNLLGVMVQFGGQTSINLVDDLQKNNVTVLGTTPQNIDRAENRDEFGKVLDKLNIPSAEWGTAYSFTEAKKIANRIGYPVLVRPSYVLGGRAMEIVQDQTQLEEYMKEAVKVSPKHPVLIDKFLQDAVEIDVDAVCDGKTVLIGGIMEHIEEAGVHSGDSACVLPPQTLTKKTIKTVKKYTKSMALELGIKGLLNIQYAVKDDKVYALEANPRASRTVPFVSKAVGVSLAKIAAKVMVGYKIKDLVDDLNPMDKINHVAVKEVVFPFIKLPDVDPVLTPEMKSTGEVIGMDMDYAMAYYKAQIAAENELPLHGSVFLSVNKKDRKKIISLARKFNEMGFEIIATPGTSRNLRDAGVINRKILKISEGSPNILDLMKSKQISLIINTPTVGKNPMRDGYKIRSSAVKLNTPYITTIAGAQAAVNAIEKVREREIEVKSWNEYFNYPT
ncbi:MAG: carbamoyl phosphate synthase large subunit [Candidatus Altiarchaeales archaeon ex4484_96]|nr:MAG: carbamoyl phosphate synthase large subunit [Candidatus Altiarchaeales archaeon ex4484_96]